MQIYRVGGCVRDRLLNLPVKDHDWVVVGADPQAMLDKGFKQVGKDFPVFLHPNSYEEYALARTERKTGPGYTGFAFHATPDVTLEATGLSTAPSNVQALLLPALEAERLELEDEMSTFKAWPVVSLAFVYNF